MCEEGGCFRSFAKVLLIIVNIIFFLAGLLMLAFGIAVVVAPVQCLNFLKTSGINFNSWQGDTGNYFVQIVQACGIFMIILGAVVAVIACFGFFGACCDNKCMLVTYAIILIIILLAEVALIIFAAVYPTAFNSTAKTSVFNLLTADFKSDIVTYPNGSLGNVSTGSGVWAALQLELGCCGSNNYTDYAQFNWTRTACPGQANTCYYQVPLSCCKLKSNSSLPASTNDFVNYNSCITTADAGSTYQGGCTDGVINLIKSYSRIAIGIAAGIVGLEIILIILAFVMCCIASDRSSKYV